MARALSTLTWPWLLILVVPVAIGIVLGLNGLWRLTDWFEFFQQPGLLKSIGYSLLVAIVAPLLALYSALLISASAQHTGAWRRTRQWLAPLLSMPHVAFAIGLLFLLSPSGWLVRLLQELFSLFPQPPTKWWPQEKSLGLMILVLVLKEIPFLLFMIAASAQQFPQQQWQRLAATMGYGSYVSWWKIMRPLLVRRLKLPFFAVVVYSLAVVDIAALVGPNTPAPLAVEVVNWQRSFVPVDQSFAAFGSFILLVAAAVMYALVHWHEGWVFKGARKQWWFMRRPWGVLAIGLGRLWQPLAVVLVIGSLAVLISWSFAFGWYYPDLSPDSWQVSLWVQEWPFLQQPLFHSLSLALITAVAALSLSVLLLEHQRKRNQQWPDWIVLLPLLVPQVSLVLGWVSLQSMLGITPRVWSSYLAVIIGHIIFALPYSYLVLASHYRSFNQRYMSIAATLGYSRWQAWWHIQWPLLRAPLLFSGAMAFAVSIAQYVPTLLLGNGRITTLTTETVALASGGDRALIALYSLLQALLPLLIFTAVLFTGRTAGPTAGRTRGVNSNAGN